MNSLIYAFSMNKPLIRCIRIFSFSFFIFGCNKVRESKININSDIETIAIDSIFTLNISNFTDSVKYITLETTPYSRIGKIKKVLFLQNFFVLLNVSGGEKKVFVYGLNGSFLYSIDKNKTIGNISDISIDKNKKQLYTYSDEDDHINIFELSSGKLISKMSAPPFFKEFRLCNNNLIFFRDGIASYNDDYDNLRVVEFDINGRFINAWINNTLNSKINGGSNIIFNHNIEFDNSILFGRFANDTLFRYESGNVYTPYIILSDKSIRKKFQEADSREAFRSYMVSDSSSYLTDKIFETSEYVYFFYKRNKSGILFCQYDKNNRFCRSYNTINNDINNIATSFPVYVDDNTFISLIDAQVIIDQYEFMKKLPQPIKGFKELNRLYNLTLTNKNPVVCIISTK